MTSTNYATDDKSLFVKIAKAITTLGILVIPLDENKVPCIKWTTRREKPLTDAEITKFFSLDRNGNTRAKYIAIALRSSSRLYIGIDTDGVDATDVFKKEFLPLLSKDLQKAVAGTTHTITPSQGEHWLFAVEISDFPDGIRPEKTYSDITIETPKTKHSQIDLLGTEKMFREYGPGYVTVKDIAHLKVLSKQQFEELIKALEQFKKDTSVIRFVGDLLKPYYDQPRRNYIVFHTSGWFWKYGDIPQALTIRLFRHIMRITAFEDENWDKTIATIKETYKNDKAEVSGREAILEDLDNKTEILAEIEQAFKQLNSDYFPGVATNGKEHDNSDDGPRQPGTVWGSDAIDPAILNELNRHKWNVKSHYGPVAY